MGNTFLLSLIWNKLGNRKIQIYSISGIFLFYLFFNLYYFFGKSGEMTLKILFLNLIISMALGIFVSGVIFFGLQNLSQKRNSFLSEIGILNKDNFIRVYIIYYMIMIPIGFFIIRLKKTVYNTGYNSLWYCI